MVLFVIIVAVIIIGIMSNELKDTKSYYEKELKKYRRQYLVMPLQSNWQRHQIQALECVSSNLTRGTGGVDLSGVLLIRTNTQQGYRME